jgi:homoserine O-acetyltransferase
MVNSVGIVKAKTFNSKKALKLESGKIINSFNLIYETYGSLNKNKDNAILIPHALSGNHHIAGKYKSSDKYPGWWDNMVGPNKAIDTKKFFVIGVNNLGGNDGSTGPKTKNPLTNKIWGSKFPIVTVKDWVASQKELIDFLGIKKLYAIVGGSLGGMQAIQWSIDFPNMVKKVLCIAAAPNLTAQNIAFNEVARQSIITDKDFNNGDYYLTNKKPKIGLRLARMLGHITYLSIDSMGKKFGRKLKDKKFSYSFSNDFEVESYLNYQGDKFANEFDANTYLRMTKALDYFDLEYTHKKDLNTIFKNVTADYLVVSFSSDWRFSPHRSKEIVKALLHNKINVSYTEIQADAGHDAFLLDNQHYHLIIKRYLNTQND